MGKTVYMFPGQGAQYIGMARDFYDRYNICKAVFDLASSVTGLDIPALCFEENEKIHITEYTQIAMLAAETAIYMAMEQAGLKPDYAAGLSLGEYGALIVSKALDPADAFRIIRKRGIFMQEAVPQGGAMAAVLGLGAQEIEAACAQTDGIVSVANYNCPGQIVITGEQDAVAAAGEACKAAGAKRVMPLKVSGPFHSKMLEGAGEKLAAELEQVPLRGIVIPYVSNVTADFVTDAAQVKGLLQKQVSSPVRWQQSVERLLAEGADEFVEIGPGHTLSGFVKKINRDAAVYHIEKPEDLEAYVNR
ncbi:MAG: ACP S-malonyltransferase [Eubacterium sp.]|jgi:[acyl-carrier-protein] S-malonyltransferase|nr:ACP S-malonyltransferase [Eubacterium sp.]